MLILHDGHPENVYRFISDHEGVSLISDVGSVVRKNEVESAMHHVSRMTEWNAMSGTCLKLEICHTFASQNMPLHFYLTMKDIFYHKILLFLSVSGWEDSVQNIVTSHRHLAADRPRSTVHRLVLQQVQRTF